MTLSKRLIQIENIRAMRKVFALGESLLDIISKNNKVITEKAGGSMLNASVSLARLNVPISLISEFAEDEDGRKIESFLHCNGVDQSYIARYKNGKTAIARAQLDHDNNAKYTFEKNYPFRRLNIDIPNFNLNDILLFGSIYAIDNEIKPILSQIIAAADKSRSLIFYDPNIRTSNLTKGDEYKVIENLHFSGIIRASDEDFKNVFGVKNFKDACSYIPNLDSKIFIYTCANRGVYIKSPLFNAFYTVPQIEVISTIGAGDSFNAGLIHAFIIHDVNKNNVLTIKEKQWESIIQHAIKIASNVCMSYDNYISKEFAKETLSNIAT